MKKLLTILLLFSLINAQDVLNTLSGKKYKGKLLEQQPIHVLFQPDGSPNAQKIPITSIKNIQLENGKIIEFGKNILTTESFSQDVLTTIGGKSVKGKVVKIEGTIVYFKQEKVKNPLRIPIRSIDKIVDNDGNPSSVLNSKEYKDALYQALSLTMFHGNNSSMLYHRGNVKHLPSKENMKSFSTVEDAESNGYMPCSACFDMRPALDDYYLEKSLVQGVNGSIRTRWEIDNDYPKFEQVEKTLTKTLDNWTETLKGYKYRIQIIVDEDPNAFAVAGGNIYLSTGLLDMIEDESELEFVIAHEVAHVERRHTLRQFKIQQRKALVGAIAAMIFGAGAYMSGSDAQTVSAVTTLSTMMIEYSNVFLMKGYSRDLEQEADIFAQLQFLNEEISNEKMTYIIDKLSNHARTMGNNITVNAFSDHPSLRSRINQIKKSEILQLDEPKNIIIVPKGKGYKSDPLINISTNLIYQCPSSSKKGNTIITLLGKISNPNKNKSYRIDKLTLNQFGALRYPITLNNLLGTSIPKDSEIDFATTIDLKNEESIKFIKEFNSGNIVPDAQLSVVTIMRGSGSKKQKNTYLDVATFFK